MNANVVGIGEVLWDILPEGRRLGGAPTNFACHAHALGAKATVVSRVGDDELGREIIERLNEFGLATDCIEVDEEVPTGTVTVSLDSSGQPTFTIHEDVAWDRLQGIQARTAVANADIICFGTLAQRTETSRRAIQSLVSAAKPGALRILDVNLRQHFFSTGIIDQSLRNANILKLNDSELNCFAEMFSLRGDTITQIRTLIATYQLRLVALTRGALGSLLVTRDQVVEGAVTETKVVDTIGAGDSFTAALGLGLIAGLPLQRINQIATEVAGYVCSCSGATPPLPPQFRSVFNLEAAAVLQK